MATNTAARIGASEPDAVARFVSKARPQHAAFLSGAEGAGVSGTLFPNLRKVEASGELVPRHRYLSAKRRQLILGLLLGICISAPARQRKAAENFHDTRTDVGLGAEWQHQGGSGAG